MHDELNRCQEEAKRPRLTAAGPGQGQNRERVHPLRHHVGNAVGQNPCFPRARTCDDHHGAIDVRRSFALRIIQIVEKIHKPKVRFRVASLMNFGHAPVSRGR